jgi:hypothetical protein
MKLSKAVKHIVFWSLIAFSVFLVITSIIVHDYSFIVDHPIAFTVEMVFFSVVCAFIIAVVFARTRKINVKETWIWFTTMVIKFALFHVLFQLSGIYTVILSPAPGAGA